MVIENYHQRPKYSIRKTDSKELDESFGWRKDDKEIWWSNSEVREAIRKAKEEIYGLWIQLKRTWSEDRGCRGHGGG